jgi:sigma-B regulation protein RsbU (phosphoserine phosphatase)
MSAGTMVSVMKGLFTAKSSDTSLERFFYNSNRTIKHINLKRMMMAFSMINLEDDKLYYLNAGMPPLYIYKNKRKEVLEIDSHNMPLGAINESKFSARELEIESGDAILLLSDGFPELQNNEGKMYGYEKLVSDFKAYADSTPQIIIEKLNERAIEWSNGKENEDDITFAVIKVK